MSGSANKLLINLLRWVLFLPCGVVGALIGLLLAHVILWIFLLFLRIIIFIGGIMVPARDQVEDGSLYELIVGWIASLCAAGFPGFIFVMAAATIAPNGPTAKKVAAIIAGIVLVVLVVTGLAQTLPPNPPPPT